MFIEDFKERGFLYQCTDIEKLIEVMSNNKITAYIGFDCTAQSLHVGSLMQIMILRLLQQHGHKAIVILGGATSKIGDPTGKDEARKALTKEDIAKNALGIKKTLSKFIRFGDKPSDALLLDNSEWLDSLNYLNFLRDFGSYFSVNRMLSMDSVKLRLEREQHMSFLEFNYMLLQAYDFYHLNKEYNCSLQIGGSDQWGNIVMGVDFTKKLTGKEAFGMTTPLMTTSSGVKMGKTVGRAIWLSEEMLSPYDYYQYWRNCEDQDVIRFAKIYSELSPEELQKFVDLTKSDINNAKKQLAYNLTKICHGSDAADLALATAIKVFEEGQIDTNLPTINIQLQRLEQGIPAYELFYDLELVTSKSEGRKLIRGRGARINDLIIEDENLIINKNFVLDTGLIKISIGKKKHVLLKLIIEY
ncbi:MAG: tyrosine--tRNA ligase [Rickettsia endosymbiont of Bryobia graminum]|nr:tyrosine--tRNA ligase [Rickettsia endosymbiont of Bryobia graminum]